MLVSISRAVPSVARRLPKFNINTIRRSFVGTISSNKNKPKQISNDKNKTEDTDVTKLMKQKFANRRRDLEKSEYTYTRRSKINSPSGYQNVKEQLRKCNNVKDVMDIMMANKKCEDVQVGTAAMSVIIQLYENSKVSAVIAMQHINEIWKVMNEYVVGMDHVAYNEYFQACSLTGVEMKSPCRAQFDQMIKNQVMPNKITLNILLGTCRRGDIKTALYYWNVIVSDMKNDADAESWAEFLAICAKVRNVELAQQYFSTCPYKNNIFVCYRMMSVYKNVGNINKVLEMRSYMQQENIEMNTRIYNTIIDAYRTAKQWQKAIHVVDESISINKWNIITINLLLDAKIGILKVTEDFIQRKNILRYIECEVANYYKECGQSDHLESFVYGNKMLDAYVSTYRNGFGSATFKECCSKYNVQYWEDVDQLDIPTVNLFVADKDLAKAILEYIFKEEREIFYHLGLNIMLNDNDRFRERFDAVNRQDVNSILSSLPTP
eukprot:340806_1